MRHLNILLVDVDIANESLVNPRPNIRAPYISGNIKQFFWVI